MNAPKQSIEIKTPVGIRSVEFRDGDDLFNGGLRAYANGDYTTALGSFVQFATLDASSNFGIGIWLQGLVIFYMEREYDNEYGNAYWKKRIDDIENARSCFECAVEHGFEGAREMVKYCSEEIENIQIYCIKND